MQAFRFNLQILMRIRRKTEERAKNEFSQQLYGVNQQQQLLNNLLLERESTEQRAKQAAHDQIDMAIEKSCAEYSQALAYKIEEAGNSLEQLKIELARRQEAMVQAQQAVKVLDKLYERRYAEYLKEAKREENNFLDEIASQHYQTAQ